MDLVEYTPPFVDSHPAKPHVNPSTPDDRLPASNPLYDKYRYTPIRILRRLTSSGRPRHVVHCQHCGDTHSQSKRSSQAEPIHNGTPGGASPLPRLTEACVACLADRDPMEPFKRDRSSTPLKRLSTFVLKSYRGHRSLSHTSSVRAPADHSARYRCSLSHAVSVRENRSSPRSVRSYCPAPSIRPAPDGSSRSSGSSYDITDKQLSDGNDDKVTDDKLTDDKVTDDKVTDDKLTDDKLTDDNLTDDETIVLNIIM